MECKKCGNSMILINSYYFHCNCKPKIRKESITSVEDTSIPSIEDTSKNYMYLIIYNSYIIKDAMLGVYSISEACTANLFYSEEEAIKIAKTCKINTVTVLKVERSWKFAYKDIPKGLATIHKKAVITEGQIVFRN